MAFTDHKIHAFTHKITDLADQPNLPPDELKARFDSSPEELRVAHNALCDDTAALDSKVESIITETFDGIIEKSMFSDELAAELDAKATQSSLEVETTALTDRLSAVESLLPQKCEVYIGSYQGNGTSGQSNSQYISLGFAPRAVIVFNQNGTIDNNGYAYGGIASSITGSSPCVRLSGTGFVVYNHPTQADLNRTDMRYGYIAFK